MLHTRKTTTARKQAAARPQSRSRKLQGDPLSRVAAPKASRRPRANAASEIEPAKLHGDPVRVRLIRRRP